MLFVATEDPVENQRRVALRGHAGGHTATPVEIADIYTRSLVNLPLAVNAFEHVELWDSSRFGAEPVLIATRSEGRWHRHGDVLPEWARSIAVD